MKKNSVSWLLVVAMLFGILGTCVSAMADSEVPVISILATPRAQCAPMSEWGMFNDAKEAAGVDINWTEVRTGWDEKKAVTLASNDLPDIFLGALNSSDISANLELFADMTDLIEQYAPNVKKMFEECPDTKASGTYEGGIYSLPRVNAFTPRSSTTISINKVWLDNLGLKVPTTIEELESCLIAFRDNDANGNGDPDDEIPFDFPNSRGHDIFCLTGAYGAVDCGNDWTWIDDGKISFLFVNDAYYKTVQFVHKWYAEGLITPEVFTNDYQQANAICSTPVEGGAARVGVITGWSPDSRCGTELGAQYITLPQLIADDASVRRWPTQNSAVSVAPDRVILTKSCSDPVAAMKLIDQFYTEDFSVQSYYGSFDTGIVTKYDDGTYSIQCPNGFDSIDSAKWTLSLVDNAPGNYSSDLQSRTKAPEELTKRVSIDAVNQPFNQPGNDIWPVLAKFTSEDSEEMAFLKTDIWSLVEQKMAQWVTSGGIEDEWDQYLAELNSMGLQDMIDVCQRTYDAYYNN